MDNKKKERNRVDKYRAKHKKKRRGFHGYKPEKVTTTTTQAESMPHARWRGTYPWFCGKKNLL